jgi:exodeoxyribonuclease V alpha subunit
MSVELPELRALGALSELDVHFASAIARLAGERDQRVLLAAALVSQKVQAGHVCLDLPALCRDETVLETDEGPRAVTWPEPEAWLAALRASPLTAPPPSVAPLHVDGAGRLYLQRYYQHEQRLARSIRERVQRPLPDIDRARLQSGLDRLFGSAPLESRGPRAQLELFAGQPDDQRLAAQCAVERAFCVISGGPGTGKTSTVVKILLLLAEQARARAEPPPRMLLLAPTGKAAARLSDAVKRAKGSLAADAAVLAAIPEEASTIHRALGAFGGHAPRFRHHRDAPLAADAVVVDEASMVDLLLMSRLLEAVPANARVLLLGDKDQLASVEAGAVLGDICGAGLPDSARADAGGATAMIAGSIALLTHSYRYGPDSGIQALAEAINGADAERALAILRDPNLPDVALVKPASSGVLPARLWADAVAGFGPLLRAHDAAGKLQALERFAVLCAHRRGPFGQLAINRRIEAALRDAGLLTSTAAGYSGRPVIVTQNDYQARLFNGEVGVLLRETAREPGSPARLLAHFSASGSGSAVGKLREVAAARLPPHESAYALSVHKSQGSEFDEVAVVLPGEASPVLSRELLYTAVTRARKRVVVYASAEIAALCVRRSVRRASGLRDALWGPTQ